MAGLVSKDSFLKWTYFFMVWVKEAVDFWIRSCAGVEDVGPKLNPQEKYFNSIGESW